MLISVGANIADFNGYIELNGTAAFIWEQLKTPRTVEELIAAMENTFDIDHEAAAADITEFLEELKANNMVETI